MSNSPPGVTDADIDYHFGEHAEMTLRDEYEADLDRERALWEEAHERGDYDNEDEECE